MCFVATTELSSIALQQEAQVCNRQAIFGHSVQYRETSIFPQCSSNIFSALYMMQESCQGVAEDVIDSFATVGVPNVVATPTSVAPNDLLVLDLRK